MENKKVFINGLISKDVSETTPEYILGKMDIQVEKLIEWLTTTGRQEAKNGWINTEVRRSKTTGKRYIQIEDDSWKTKTKVEVKKEVKEDIVIPKMDTGEVNIKDLPF